MPSLRYAASSPRTPATKQTRRDSPDSPSSPNPSQTKRREHGDIAPVPGVEEEKPTGASGNQATTLVAADCTGANADGRGGPMQTLSEGLASLSTADRAAPATTKVHSAITLYTHTLHSILLLGAHILHSYSALILAAHTLHLYSTPILCTRTLHPCSTPVLYTGTLHSCSSSEHRRCHQWPSLWIRCVELSCERRKELCMSTA